jgi:hypothetical protein
VPLSAVTTSGQVVLSWWHNGDPAAIAYWIGLTNDGAVSSTATSTRQTVTWLRVAPPVYCQEIRYTVPGVARQTNYTLILSLEARTPETWAGVSRVVLNQAAVRLP